MIRSGGAIVALAALLAAAPALAQPPAAPADPIDALLKRPPPKDVDPEEPDTAASGGRVEPDPVVPSAPRAPPRRSTLTTPVQIEETGKSPDGPPTAADAAYDSRLKSSMASAQGFQGPLEGGWSVLAGERELYVLQLVDRGGGVEGAWRDPRRLGALDASGFIDGIDRAGDDLTVRIGPVLVTLHAADGRWSGQISENGRTQAVVLRRRRP